MIIKEFYKLRNDGTKLFRTYSNENFKIIQNETGAIYDDAIDVENSQYTYLETNEKIEEIEIVENEFEKIDEELYKESEER